MLRMSSSHVCVSKLDTPLDATETALGCHQTSCVLLCQREHIMSVVGTSVSNWAVIAVHEWLGASNLCVC